MLSSLICGYKVETSIEGSPYKSSLATDEIIFMIDMVDVYRNMTPTLISESETTKQANVRKYEQRGAFQKKKSFHYKNKDKLRKKNNKKVQKKFEDYDFRSESSDFFQPLRMNLKERVTGVTERFYDMGYDEIASRVEDIVLFTFALRGSSSFAHAASIIAMKIKDLCKSDRALTKTVFKYLFGGTSIDSIVKFLKVDCNPGDILDGLTAQRKVDDLLDDFNDDSLPEFFSEATVPDSTSTDKKEANRFEQFITSFAKATEGYGRIMASPLMSKMTTLMSTLLALGMIGDQKSCAVTFKGLEIFNFYASKGRKTATDLVEVVLDTIKFLLERGHACFTQGTLTPLFTSVEKLAQYDLDYSLIVSGYDYVRADNYEGSTFMDAAHFELELRGLLDYTTRLVKALSRGERAPYAKKLLELQKIKADLDTRKVQGGLRKAPFSFFIHGSSGVGKSTAVNTLIAHSLQEIALHKGNKDFVVKESAICTLNEMDKYHSDYGSHILAVLLDDFANGKPEYAAKNPTIDVINFNNNIHRTAIMAEAELKGKIPLIPCVVGATSNVKKEFAMIYSQEPLSVLRRFHIHLNMKVRKEYQKANSTQVDSMKLAEQAEKGILTPDAWIFHAYEWVEGEDTPFQKITGSREPVEKTLYFMEDGKKKLAKDINFGQVLELFSQYIPQHEVAQTSCVDSAKKILCRPRCPHGKNQDWCDVCKETPIVPVATPYASNADLMISESNIITETTNNVCKTLQGYKDNMNCVQTYRQICNEYETLLAITPVSVYSRLPETLRENPVIKALILSNVDHTFVQIYRFWIIFFLCCLYMPLFGIAPMSSLNYFVGLSLPFIYLQIEKRKAALEEMVSTSSAIHASTVQSIKENQSKLGKQLFVGAGLTLAAVTLAHQVYRAFKPVMTSEADEYVTDVCQWKVTPERENVWKTPEISPLPTGVCHSSSYDDLYKVFSRALCSVRFKHTHNTQETHSNGFWLCTNVLVIPAHERPKDEIRIDVVNRNIKNLNGVNLLNVRLTPECCMKIHEDSDLAIAYIGCSGDKKNLIKFFPDELSEKSIIAKMITRRYDNQELEERVCAFTRFNPVKTARAYFKNAAHYQWEEPSFGGLCGSPLIRDSRSSSYIAGIHLAGSQKVSGYNACEMVTKSMFEKALKSMELDDDKVFGISEGSMRVEEYGIDYNPSPEVPKNSPLNFIAQDSSSPRQISILGSVPKFNTRAKSRVVESPLSKFIETRCGVPNVYGPPPNCRKITLENGETRRAIPEYEPYQVFLNGVGNARQEFSSKVLSRAMQDFRKKFADAISASKTLQDELAEIRPLTDVETVSGIDGEKFVDQMKPQTSTGFPLNTPKENYMIHLDPEEVTTHADPKILKDEIMAAAREDALTYIKGERAYPVLKACQKDEVTKLSKLKVRIFQAAPLKTQFLLRKYFLKIAKFLSDNPILSECAVGVNAHGPQWHQLDSYMAKFGSKGRTVAGDFKGYDQHMSARMIMLAFDFMIDFAEKSGNYTPEDIKIMKGLMTDIVYPIIMVGGTLVQLFGSNSSGHGLTVYVNGIVNSLYHRSVFFIIYPKYQGMFHHVVALMTYGDDVKFSVHQLYDKYNHTRIQAVFADHGIVYTMAEKDAESVPFLDHTDADFLKRKSKWCTQYSWRGSEGMWLGRLDENSIFKSLHANLESPENSRTEIAVQCLDSAMRELWFHGRSHFECRHEELKMVVEDAGLKNAMPKSFYDGFDAREEAWLERYEIEKVSVMESESGCVGDIPQGAAWCETESLRTTREYLSSPELCAVDISPDPCSPEYEFPQIESDQTYGIQFPMERKIGPLLIMFGLIFIIAVMVGPWTASIKVDLTVSHELKRWPISLLLIWFFIANQILESYVKQVSLMVFISDIMVNITYVAETFVLPIVMFIIDFRHLVNNDGFSAALKYYFE